MVSDRKNVIILHADQMRYDSLSCHGNVTARTPVIDRLASEGCDCSRHITGSPICMPSRSCLLTGLHIPGHGVWTNGVPLLRAEDAVVERRHEQDQRFNITPEPRTIADHFGAAGYDSACIGKMHLTPSLALREHRMRESVTTWASGVNRDWHGPYYGFRHAELTHGHGDRGALRHGHYADWARAKAPGLIDRLLEGHPPSLVQGMSDIWPSELPSELHHSSWIADRCIAWLREGRDRQKPFLLFAGFPDPHHPFTPPADVFKEFADAPTPAPRDPEGRGLDGVGEMAQTPVRIKGFGGNALDSVHRTTAAMISLIDRNIGRILDELKKQGLDGETVIVFTSDHGDFLGDHGLLYKVHMAFDSLLHVPCIIRAPGCGLPRKHERAISNVDVLPTLASLCGVPLETPVHGVNRFQDSAAGMPVLSFSSTGHAQWVGCTVYDDTHRYTTYPVGGVEQCFDHSVDPGECSNLAAEGKVPGHLRGLLAEGLLRCWQPNTGQLCVW